MSRHCQTLLPCCLAFALVACVKPSDTFEEFEDRVVDAGTTTVEGCEGEIPDVNGEFYLALSPVIAPSSFLQFVVDTEMTRGDDGAVSLDLSFQPLCVQEDDCELRTPIGAPLVVNAVTVDGECSFRAELTDATVQGEANPISGTQISGDIIIVGNIKGEASYCGSVEGMLQEPIPLDLQGSTFAAQRIEAGTIGDALPEAIATCPADDEPDAGVPDAGPSDAGVDDAGADDAGDVDGGEA